MGKKLATTIYITEEQEGLLKELNVRTKVPMAEYIREGIDLVLEKYKNKLSRQLSFEELQGEEVVKADKADKEVRV
jgi:hypothetical protein